MDSDSRLSDGLPRRKGRKRGELHALHRSHDVDGALQRAAADGSRPSAATGTASISASPDGRSGASGSGCATPLSISAADSIFIRARHSSPPSLSPFSLFRARHSRLLPPSSFPPSPPVAIHAFSPRHSRLLPPSFPRKRESRGLRTRSRLMP